MEAREPDPGRPVSAGLHLTGPGDQNPGLTRFVGILVGLVIAGLIVAYIVID